ncbi:MAG: ATP-binding protein [Patescibacteria group bacterium]
MIIKRELQEQLEKWLFKKKALIVYGARQVGKTTLVKSILRKFPNSAYFDCETISAKQSLSIADPVKLRRFIGNTNLVILDEAQKVENIGLSIKLLVDNYPELQIIATGSSSFDLANKINEPLTGRALDFFLYPFSVRDMTQIFRPQDISQNIERFLVYGTYPEITFQDEAAAKIYLDNLTAKYLYKDLLEFDKIKKSDILVRLLQMLALQIGNEVSSFELSRELGVDRITVIKYIDLLEKAFVVFRLRPFSRNLRKEINKKNKIYFCDLGVRNSLIANFNPLSLRQDTGALWENFCVAERIKYLQILEQNRNSYFWRTHDQKEIDYLEEWGGKIEGYEFKWKKETFTKPAEFIKTYPQSSISLVNNGNYEIFLGLIY